MSQDKYVCADCFTDPFIKNFINANSFDEKCSYCLNESDEPIAASLEEVVGFIREGIETEWDNPVNCVGWESAEGGWMGANVIDSYELVHDEIEELYHDTKTDILDDIAFELDQEWCQRDPYGLPEEETLILSWEDFEEKVKHETRYVFLKNTENDIPDYRSDMIPVHKMLDRLSEELSYLEDEGLVKLLAVGETIYRARIHDSKKRYETAKDLGTAPADKAKYSNRMSPAGIPMFYGAFDSDTPIEEIVNDGDNNSGKCASIGVFSFKKPLRLLDLTLNYEFPSIFDENRRHLRSTIIFIRAFVHDLSKPIKKDGMEHIEYVPTQVFTEYIRNIYKDVNGNSVIGILYPSSKKETGICCVLFVENNQCCDPGNVSNSHYLQLESVVRQEL